MSRKRRRSNKTMEANRERSAQMPLGNNYSMTEIGRNVIKQAYREKELRSGEYISSIDVFLGLLTVREASPPTVIMGYHCTLSPGRLHVKSLSE